MRSLDASRGSKGGRRGSAVVEVSLLAPWVLFLFVGMFDMGMYTYSMVGVENAARVAAEYSSQSASAAGYTGDASSGACAVALKELVMLPNMSSQANCNTGVGNAVVVTATAVNSTTTPASIDGKPATLVQVSYTGNQLVPIPGLLMGQLNITRTVEVRIKP